MKQIIKFLLISFLMWSGVGVALNATEVCATISPSSGDITDDGSNSLTLNFAAPSAAPIGVETAFEYVNKVSQLKFVATHPDVFDLTATLTSPAGTALTLVQHVCDKDHENFNMIFDDAAPTFLSAPSPDTSFCTSTSGSYIGGITGGSSGGNVEGTAKLHTSLSSLDGENFYSSAWTLALSDNEDDSTGIIHHTPPTQHVDNVCLTPSEASIKYNVYVSKTATCTDKVTNETFSQGETVYVCANVENTGDFDFVYSADANDAVIGDFAGTTFVKSTNTPLITSFTAGGTEFPVGTTSITADLTVKGIAGTLFPDTKTLQATNSASVVVQPTLIYSAFIGEDTSCNAARPNSNFKGGENIYMCYIVQNTGTIDFDFISETNNLGASLAAELSGTYAAGTTTNVSRIYVAGSPSFPNDVTTAVNASITTGVSGGGSFNATLTPFNVTVVGGDDDLDGIHRDMDLDKDGDGILDSVECAALPIPPADFSTVSSSGASTVTINPSGGGKSSSNLRIVVKELGRIQVYKKGKYQFYTGSNTSAAVYLAVGSTTYGAQTNAPASSPDADTKFKPLSLSQVVGDGSEGNSYGVQVVVYADTNNNGTYEASADFKVTIEYSYVSTMKTIQVKYAVLPPAGNTDPIKLYHQADTYLDGGDSGDGYALDANGVNITSSTVPYVGAHPVLLGVTKNNGSFLAFIENGDIFDYFTTGFYSVHSPQIESALHLVNRLDPKYQDQMIRTTISLPNGSGKTSKVCAFTDGNTDELIKA